MIGWAWNNAWWIIPGAAYVVVVTGAWLWLGRAAAIAVATAGIGHLAFIAGGRRERAGHDKRARDIQKKREDAYREIDDRQYDRNDAAERLRRNDY